MWDGDDSGLPGGCDWFCQDSYLSEFLSDPLRAVILLLCFWSCYFTLFFNSLLSCSACSFLSVFAPLAALCFAYSCLLFSIKSLCSWANTASPSSFCKMWFLCSAVMLKVVPWHRFEQTRSSISLSSFAACCIRCFSASFSSKYAWTSSLSDVPCFEDFVPPFLWFDAWNG